MAIKRVGVLTGGGDCPGLNAVIRGLVTRLAAGGVATVGLLEGWRGLLEARTRDLSVADVRDILHLGGTILGSSRTNPFKNAERDVPRVLENVKKLKLDALVPVGGDDTLGVAAKLYTQHKLPTVGVPKTIDNDLSGTEFTFGFDTAVEVCTQCIDRVRTTAESHRRVLVVEVMGRHAGWIAGFAGLAAGADWVCVPEEEIDIEALAASLARGREAGDLYNLVVVAEGAKLAAGGAPGGAGDVTQDGSLDSFGHVKLGGIGKRLAKLIEEKTGFEARHVILGHVQRGGAPTATDRILGTRYGVKAAEMVLAGEFGRMPALVGSEIKAVDLSFAAGETKTLRPDYLALAKVFYA